MSIIHDALKKVQQQRSPASPDVLPPSAPAREPARPPADTNPHLLRNIAWGVLAIVILAAYPLIALNRSKSITPAQANDALPTPAADIIKTPPAPAPAPVPLSLAVVPEAKPASASAAPAPAPAPAPVKTSDPNDPLSNIQIEGVMDMGGKKAALINGNVYEEGQTIYGKIISQINFDTLTIIDNGQKRTFPIKP